MPLGVGNVGGRAVSVGRTMAVQIAIGTNITIASRNRTIVRRCKLFWKKIMQSFVKARPPKAQRSCVSSLLLALQAQGRLKCTHNTWHFFCVQKSVSSLLTLYSSYFISCERSSYRCPWPASGHPTAVHDVLPLLSVSSCPLPPFAL